MSYIFFVQADNLSYQKRIFEHPTRRQIFANTVGRICKPKLTLRHIFRIIVHILDNAGGGAVLGQCSRRKERLERVASTGRASTKGLQLFLCVVCGCVCNVICVQVRTAKSEVL